MDMVLFESIKRVLSCSSFMDNVVVVPKWVEYRDYANADKFLKGVGASKDPEKLNVYHLPAPVVTVFSKIGGAGMYFGRQDQFERKNRPRPLPGAVKKVLYGLDIQEHSRVLLVEGGTGEFAAVLSKYDDLDLSLLDSNSQFGSVISGMYTNIRPVGDDLFQDRKGELYDMIIVCCPLFRSIATKVLLNLWNSTDRGGQLAVLACPDVASEMLGRNPGKFSFHNRVSQEGVVGKILTLAPSDFEREPGVSSCVSLVLAMKEDSDGEEES